MPGPEKIFCAVFLFCLTALGAVDPMRLPPPATNQIDFIRDVRPIIEQSCLKCHSGDRPKGKFALTTRENALKGGGDQVDILIGQSGKSPLIQFVARVIQDSEMPPTGKGGPLTAAQVGTLRAWIDQGAKWPTDLVLGDAMVAKKILSTNSLPPAASRPVDFVKDVQPILAENCYTCHGPKQHESQLRWDNKQIAMHGGEHGKVIIPGNSAASRMIQLVGGLEPDLIMPQKGAPLTAVQVGLLRAWIDQGAVWPESASVKVVDPRDHWAFKAPVRPAVPIVKNKSWVRNPIDSFVMARLEAENLRPSPEADRPTLLRRLSLDLIGLPPTIDEINAFVADHRPDAYDQLVQRLLASPHYGERWARHWLDAARYADSNGYEKDLARSIWPYRDWVINAYNSNMPFDQFAIDQLAGDLLPNSTIQEKVATGFLRNSLLNEEGGVDPEQFRVESIIGRVDVLGKAFLGLTLNCCQCHNHKYDPFSQKEYYQFFAFLNNDDEPEMEVPSIHELPEREAIEHKIASMEDELLAQYPDIPKKMSAWEDNMKALVRDWTVLEPISYFGSVGTKFNKLSDDSLLATASNPPFSAYTVIAKTDLTGITGIRLEALADPNLPGDGPGRATNGNFVLSEFTLEAAPETPDAKTNKVRLQNATADFSQGGFPVTAAIDGVITNKIGWAIGDLPGRRNRDHQAVFELKTPLGFTNGTVLKFTLHQSYGQEHTIGRFRLSITRGAQPLQADPLHHRDREIISIPREQRTAAQTRELFSSYRLVDPRFAEANKKMDEEQAKWPSAPTTLVLEARDQPRETHIFKRGDWQKPGALVHPGVPAILNPLPKGAPLNRLTLGKWLVDRKNPTVARVMVNRIWQEYFGHGIVATSEDFGTQGDPPTHPKLLDWLAVEFMDSGWNVKHIQQLIAESATYRESSVVTVALWEKDQYNQFLARGPRVRVDAEIIRDIALSAGGLLNDKIGGPSVYPPIPDGVLSLGYGSPMRWGNKDKSENYRRAMYTFAKRSVPYPSLQVFDAPTGELPCPRRIRSNTPLQALTTLNDPVFFEAARAMALRVWKDGGTNEQSRIDYAFELCTGRKPQPKEVATISSLLEDQSRFFEDRTARAVKVASPDPKDPPPDVNLHKVAAWTMVSRVLLNMDETITKE
ncbi:MAG TPA: PSD1 and planctomycete cytochrome C domain-containing protein [Candidatus Saccharimonadales bacterium]|nr:PSD1 and planctomycete cytochrome C domain-containing protein [Candidatus Saccharimonadales bacterium]